MLATIIPIAGQCQVSVNIYVIIENNKMLSQNFRKNSGFHWKLVEEKCIIFFSCKLKY